MKKFTLIELLVVISIIGILASLLLPTLGKARKTSLKAVCTSKFKQIFMAQMAYTDDHDGQISGMRHGPGDNDNTYRWSTALLPYTNSVNLYFCPSEDRAGWRPGEDGLKLNPEVTDMKIFLDDIGQLFTSQLSQKKLDLVIYIIDDVPSELIFDPVRVRQVFINLITNAIKFTNKGGVSVNVGWFLCVICVLMY